MSILDARTLLAHLAKPLFLAELLVVNPRGKTATEISRGIGGRFAELFPKEDFKYDSNILYVKLKELRKEELVEQREDFNYYLTASGIAEAKNVSHKLTSLAVTFHDLMHDLNIKTRIAGGNKSKK